MKNSRSVATSSVTTELELELDISAIIDNSSVRTCVEDTRTHLRSKAMMTRAAPSV